MPANSSCWISRCLMTKLNLLVHFFYYLLLSQSSIAFQTKWQSTWFLFPSATSIPGQNCQLVTESPGLPDYPTSPSQWSSPLIENSPNRTFLLDLSQMQQPSCFYLHLRQLAWDSLNFSVAFWNHFYFFGYCFQASFMDFICAAWLNQDSCDLRLRRSPCATDAFSESTQAFVGFSRTLSPVLLSFAYLNDYSSANCPYYCHWCS